jgi:uncharacterized membrane protein YraQ (UPF0718 family)
VAEQKLEWAAILRDLIIGLLAAGAIAAWVPDSFWQAFFFTGGAPDGSDEGHAHAGHGHAAT